MTVVEQNTLPRQIEVSEILSSRYEPGTRPVSWDNRVSGVEKIVTDKGEEVSLASNGGQSTPAPGWVLVLTGETEGSSPSESVYEWTLYGVRPTS